MQERLLTHGTLHVSVIRATNLKAVDNRGTTSDPYVKLAIGDKKHKTKHVSKNLNPQWNESFSFDGELRELAGKPLQLEVVDHNTVLSDTSLGSATIDLNVLRQNPAHEFEVALSQQGHVYVRVVWEARGGMGGGAPGLPHDLTRSATSFAGAYGGATALGAPTVLAAAPSVYPAGGGAFASTWGGAPAGTLTIR